MADAAEGKRTYPYVSNNVWAELKARFEKSLPAKVTPSYLQTVLGFSSEKAASNLVPQLRSLGLIDSENLPTPLAGRFRLDSEYAAAASEIVEATYPDELRNIYPGPEEDVAAVANWFMRDTGGGRSSALIQARFYLGLVSGKLPASERAARKPKVSVAADATARGGTTNTSTRAPRAPKNPPTGGKSGGASGQGSEQHDRRPELHIDIQVHIDSSASADQIDAVFASMSKHLYGRE